MTKFIILFAVFGANLAFAQEPQDANAQLDICTKETKAAYQNFWREVLNRHGKGVTAVKTNPNAGVELEISLARASGRLRQFSDVTVQGLAKYCESIKAVEDQAAK